MGSTSSILPVLDLPGDTWNKSHGTRSTSFAAQGMRSTSTVCVGDYSTILYDSEVVTACATSVDAHPKELPPHQPWQLPGEQVLSTSELNFGVSASPPPGGTW
eukprot:4317039-Amphidinium_carterae.1